MPESICSSNLCWSVGQVGKGTHAHRGHRCDPTNYQKEPEDTGQKPHRYAPWLLQPLGLRLNLSTNVPKQRKTSAFQQPASSPLFFGLTFHSPCFYRRNYSLKRNLFTPAEIPSRRHFGELPALFRIGYVTVYTFCCKLAPSALMCVSFSPTHSQITPATRASCEGPDPANPGSQWWKPSLKPAWSCGAF